jgi:curved DNA-binding protein CbpA
MDIKRYFEILELQPGASMDELNQAYKDLVNIWHPDRFAHNPRLKKKAEEKLKEVNRAYEALRPLLSSGSGLGNNAKPGSHGQPQADAGIEEETSSVHQQAGEKSQTEALVEASTANVLRIWSYLSTRLRRLVGEQVQAFREGAYTDQQGASRSQGRGGGRGKGKGGARPRGQRMGRGKRRGGGRGGMGRGGA